MASQNVVLAKGHKAGGAFNKKRFLKWSANDEVVQCTVAGEKSMGVSLFAVSLAEIDKGKHASVLTIGRAIVEAGNNTPTIGGPATTDASGRAIAAASGNFILGYFDEVPDGVDAGYEVSVALTNAGAKVP